MMHGQKKHQIILTMVGTRWNKQEERNAREITVL